LNPVFNEEFFFETRPNDLESKKELVITVWDKDIGKSNDFLGSLVFSGQTSKGRRLKHWRDSIILPDQYHEQWHSLSPDLPGH
jgi:rabphilin-3A